MAERSMMIYVFMVLLAIGLLACYIWLGTQVGSKDTNNELSKNLTIIAVVTGICTVIWTMLIYIYFATDTSIAIPYLFISQGFVMFIALTSLGLSSIQSINISQNSEGESLS